MNFTTRAKDGRDEISLVIIYHFLYYSNSCFCFLTVYLNVSFTNNIVTSNKK